MKNLQARESKLDIIFPAFIIAVMLGMMFFACPFSPFYRYCFEPDEVCYRIMAKGLLHGKVPYRDLFDHKGPLMYCIYAIGLLLTGESSIGLWILFSLVNALTFLMLYKTARLFFEPASAFLGILLTIAFLFAFKNPIFSSGCKPEHLVFCLLVLSEYLFLKRIKERKTSSPEKAFSVRDMLILGLLCGGVFLLKLNYCIYYLCFIGSFFVFQLARKNVEAFLRSMIPFVCGILLDSLPFLIFFGYHGAMDDLIDAYVVFNSQYIKTFGYQLFIFQPAFVGEIKIVIACFFIVILAAFLLAYSKARKDEQVRTQLVIYAFLALIIIGFITLPQMYRYTFVTLVPILFIGPCYFVSFLRKNGARVMTTIVSLGLCCTTMILSLMILIVKSPKVPKEKMEIETRMEQYTDTHPDATYMFYQYLCIPSFYEKTSAVPDFKYFYAPNANRLEIIAEQDRIIQEQVPDVLVFYSLDQIYGDEFVEERCTFFDESGYSLYDVFGMQDRSIYVYVRAD